MAYKAPFSSSTDGIIINATGLNSCEEAIELMLSLSQRQPDARKIILCHKKPQYDQQDEPILFCELPVSSQTLIHYINRESSIQPLDTLTEPAHTE